MSSPLDTGPHPASDLAYPQSRFTPLAGLEVHHEVHGEPDSARPAVLLSHHFYGNTRTWRHVLDGLRTHHLAVAFDRPGFGLTERPPRRRGEEPYTRATAARIGWELLDHLGVERSVLIGSSAGGTNVLEMYARQPARVAGLVLISPAITGDVGPPSGLRGPLRAPVLRHLGPGVVRRLARSVDVERISRSWSDPSRATTEDAEPYQRMLQVEGWASGLWEVVNAEPPPDLRETVRAIDVPTLVVAGEHDRIIAPRWNRRTAGAIPGARFEVIPGCGHTPQEECPQQLLTLVRGFLAGLDT